MQRPAPGARPGSSTGKLTRQLQIRGLDVTAVEPSQGMREQLVTAVPQARALDGTAESIPLPDTSMDAVLVAEAWRWVDTRRAIPEGAGPHPRRGPWACMERARRGGRLERTAWPPGLLILCPAWPVR
ncbi:methyltransferase domain-containing protein [Streptomyces sp. NPDC002896]|uniref:class I SAM-dependent methyltransferase n=1 Tax=Streptomyces sp. NPDC002896 TaxID=3154438 RepID=UPI0033293B0C